MGSKMSFIYDNPWLVNQLLQAGYDSENKLSKKGQAPPANQQVGESLKALLNNLRDQITPLQEGADQVGMASGGAELASHHMDSMGDLVDWLSKNGTRIGGKVIVQPGNTDRPSEEYGYYKIEPGTEIVVPIARPDRSVVAYWINGAALKQYLVSLQADQKMKEVVIFQVQLLKLIQDANKQLDLDISEQYKAPEEVLPDDTPIDTIPNPVDPQNPYQENGSVPLIYGNVKSFAALRDWLMGKNMTMKTDEGKIAKAGNADFDLCAFLSVLNARAANAARWGKKGGTQYQAQVQAVAKEANCTLSAPGQGGATSGQGGSDISPQLLQQLAAFLPFNSQTVNLNDLKMFVDKYAQLSRRNDIVSMARQVGTSINEAMNLMKTRTMIIPLEQMRSSNDLQPWHAFAKNASLADVLYTIVNDAGMIYTDFVNVARNKLDQDTVLKISQQVDDGGPWSVNMDDINQFRTDLQQEAQRGGR